MTSLMRTIADCECCELLSDTVDDKTKDEKRERKKKTHKKNRNIVSLGVSCCILLLHQQRMPKCSQNHRNATCLSHYNTFLLWMKKSAAREQRKMAKKELKYDQEWEQGEKNCKETICQFSSTSSLSFIFSFERRFCFYKFLAHLLHWKTRQRDVMNALAIWEYKRKWQI